MPKKVLVITYYWPPAGGIAVQRWVKFCKYLSEYGWEPIVYTVSNGHYQLTDNSMLKDIAENQTVIKQPIWEPHKLYQALSKKKTEGSKNVNPDEIKPGGKVSLLKKISVWVRSNFFIPDARRFWIKPSIKFLTDYVSQNKVDAIVSTGPPHSAHLIAMGLKKRTQLPWLADFRDPWTTMDYYLELSLTRWADRKHHRLEMEVITSADAITVVGNGMKQEFESKRGGEVVAVTNGFDEADFPNEQVEIDKEFTLLHIGSFYARINPTGFWKALAELKQEGHPLFKKLKLKLIGRIAPSIIDEIKAHDLEEFLIAKPFIPHSEAIHETRRAAVLLLFVYEENKFIVTGKLFEYLAAQRPILFTGSKDGDAANIVRETEVGPVFTKDEVQAIKKHIVVLFDQFEKGELKLSSDLYKKYSHRMLAKMITDELNRISKSSVN